MAASTASLNKFKNGLITQNDQCVGLPVAAGVQVTTGVGLASAATTTQGL